MTTAHRAGHDLSAYLDGELLPEDIQAVEAHLRTCAPCRTELEALRATRRLLGRLATPPLPPEFAARLAARAEVAAHRRWVWWPRPALAAAVVAMVVLLVAVPAFLGQRERLRAAEVGPDLFIREAAHATAADPFADRAFLSLVAADANVRVAGEDPRGAGEDPPRAGR